MTYKNALIYGKEVLRKFEVPDAELDAWYLMEYACRIDKGWYYLHGEKEMDDKEFQFYERLLNERGKRVPLQYITGSQEFMGLEFKVNSHVLIPRQDTETLVEAALKVLKPGMKVLDLCTGSGCVIISLRKRMEIIAAASDISSQALQVAQENARRNQTNICLVRSDLFENITGVYDMIVANPPYIPTKVIGSLMPEVKDFEPLEALDGKEDGVYFYRKIIAQSREYLKPDGFLYLEIGNDQGGKVSLIMKENSYQNVKVVKDLAGNDRVVCGVLPSAQ